MLKVMMWIIDEEHQFLLGVMNRTVYAVLFSILFANSKDQVKSQYAGIIGRTTLNNTNPKSLMIGV